METMSMLSVETIHAAHSFLMSVPVQVYEHAAVVVTATFGIVNQFRDPAMRACLRIHRQSRRDVDAVVNELESHRDTID